MPAKPKHIHDQPKQGECFGHYNNQRTLGDWTWADLVPTIPEADIEPHEHDNAHFLLLIRGTYLSSAAGMPPTCSEPTLIINPPGTKHRDRFAETSGQFLTFSIPHQAWEAAKKQRSLPEHATKSSHSALVTGINMMHELRHWTPSSSAFAMECWCDYLLDLADPMIHTRHKKHPSPTLTHISERLRDEPANAPTLSSLAEEVGMHRVYLARAFRKQFGCSPSEYFQHHRMQHAIAALHQDHQSISDVAHACGFSDQSHFTHHFRKRHGVTPNTYRKHWRNIQNRT